MAPSRSRIVLFQHRCDALVALPRAGSFREGYGALALFFLLVDVDSKAPQ